MEPTQDRVAALRTALAGLSGPARFNSLIRLHNALLSRSTRAGLGTSSGRADLDAAIAAIEEACGYLGRDDRLRAPVVNRLGWLLAIRHLVTPGGDGHDRVRAIRLLEESLNAASLSPAKTAGTHLMLSQLHLTRVRHTLESVTPSAMLQGGAVASEHLAEADRAVAHAKQVVEAPVVTSDFSHLARFILKAAESARDQIQMVHAGVGGLNQGMLRRMLGAIQEFEDQSSAAGGMAGFFGGGDTPGQSEVPSQLIDLAMAAAFGGSPLEAPAVVVHGPEPAPPPARPEPPPAGAATDVERLRVVLGKQFAELLTAARAAAAPDAAPTVPAETGADQVVEPAQTYLSAVALLRPDVPALPVDGVDECVALATSIVYQVETTDPACAGMDRFLLAVALFLRAHGVDTSADGTGWAAGDSADRATDDDWADGARDDLTAGLDSLLRAAEALSPGHPAAIEVCTALGAFLDDRQPLRTLTDRVAGGFADRADAVIAAWSERDADLAVVRAVSALCRSAIAVRAGSFDGTGELGATVAAVPEGYPWQFRLRAAAGVAAVADALARRDPIALPAAGLRIAESLASGPPRYADSFGARVLRRLAAVLGALDADMRALRVAVDDLAGVSDARTTGRAEAIRIRALLGGLHLLLDGDDDGDRRLTSAIESLSAATTHLADDPDAVLRAASWWRLAEAHRRRGTRADLEQSRLAATRALRAPVREPGDALRFAGWMLDGGGALEAFEALEAAALAKQDSFDPLIRDVATVLLGPGVPAGTPTADPRMPPTVGEVAAALRTIGAAALVYLHPVPDPACPGDPQAVPGRPHRVGVLLVDALAERLSLLGTVSAPDLTATGPPAGWSDEAFGALVEPLLTLPTPGSMPRRVLVSATGALGRLPLPAIRTRAGGYVASDLVTSSVGSGRHVVELARRAPLPVPENAVFVANPRGDRDLATFEAMTLRRTFYPSSIGLGRTAEQVHGAGTPADVLAYLPGSTGSGASLLHLGCALRTTGTPGLELAHPDPAARGPADSGLPDPADGDARAVLTTANITARASEVSDCDSGGLVILPADAGEQYERWIQLADALLDGGMTGVIGWLWPVPEPVAALMLVVLHGKLVDEGLPPATAVNEVHRWMLAPDRIAPPYLPAGPAAALRDTDLTEPRYWAALCHRGR